jgi:hypothetical protein
VRSLEFLEFTYQPLATPPFLLPLLPLCRAAGRHRSPPLQLCRCHLLPLAAPTHCPEFACRPSPSPLAFSRTCHTAPPLPEHHPRPPRTPSAASSCYYSPCPLLVLKHAPGRSSTSSTPSRARCCLLLPSARLLLPDLRRSPCPLSSAHPALSQATPSPLAVSP